MGCKIVGHGKALPELIVSNDDMAKIVDTSDEWIVERTGIHNRRIALEETTTSLGTDAARNALADAGLAADDDPLPLPAKILRPRRHGGRDQGLTFPTFGRKEA